MSEEILINVTPRETRVALVENGMLQEVQVERASRRGYVGNIYKGKVSRVMPGMQAAFVEIGLDRAAFLHASDVVRLHSPLIGDNGEAAPAPTPPIGELVRDGQEIVVQVVKDPIGTKGARLTTHLSIPSRHLVLLPYSKVLGVSVRIEDEAERARLKELLAELSGRSQEVASADSLPPGQPSGLSSDPTLERPPVAIHGSPSAAGGLVRAQPSGFSSDPSLERPPVAIHGSPSAAGGLVRSQPSGLSTDPSLERSPVAIHGSPSAVGGLVRSQPSGLSTDPSLERSPVAIHGSPSAAGGLVRSQPSGLSTDPSLERSPVAIHGSPSAAGGPLRPQPSVLGSRSPGYIVRTNAEGESREALAEDVDYLGRLWTALRAEIEHAKVGRCIYEDLSLPLRALRDLMRPSVEKVRVDSRETFERALRFAQQFMPELAERVEHYPGERPIFDLYGVEDEIQKALRKEVPLKSGGYLIVDQTEAMTTIDVNTGAFLGSRNLEETVFRTNLEAAQATARQLRLRNLGGIIIIDFIDMTDAEHRRQVLRQLQKSMARDPAKATVYEMSPLGLVEMTRKRTTESLERQLCEPCPACAGRGSLKTAETVTYEIFREITRAVRQFEAKQLLVLAAPKVVNRILEEDSAAVAELEEFIGKTIRFQAEEHYSQEQYDVVVL